MKLYTYDPAPSPRRVALFMNWKGIELETQQVDLMTEEQLGEEYRAVNPDCTVPALVLDDGTMLNEVIGICTYLENQYPEKPLLGTTPLEKALVSTWNHKILLGIFTPIVNMLRNRSSSFQNRALPGTLDLPQIPELVERGELQLRHFMPVIDAHLANNTWMAGDKLSFADIDLLVSVNFLAWVKQAIPDDCSHLKAWYDRASEQLT